MLTESFFVRRVKKVEDPETGEMRPEADPEGEVGVVRTIQFVPIADPNSPVGQRAATILGVCWEKSNYPAITWEDPEDLEHLDDTLMQVIDRLQEDYGDDFLNLMIPKLVERFGATSVAEAAFTHAEESGEEEEEEPEENETSEAAEAAEAQPAH